MNRRRFLTIAGAAAIPSWAVNSWEKPFPDWDAGIRDRILTDSPWARQQTVTFDFAAPPPAPRNLQTDFQEIELPRGMGLPRIPESTRGGNGRSPVPGPGAPGDVARVPARSEMFLVVRWSSALPIRQALALEQWGKGGLESARAKELLDDEPGQYVIDIAGFPVLAIPQGPQWLEKELAKSAVLWARGKKPVRASAVTVPEHGNHLIAEMRFSRADAISVEDEVVEITAEAGPVKIARTFRPKQMMYRGKLEM